MMHAAIMATRDEGPRKRVPAPGMRLKFRVGIGHDCREGIPDAMGKTEFEFAQGCHEQDVPDFVPHPSWIGCDSKRLCWDGRLIRPSFTCPPKAIAKRKVD